MSPFLGVASAVQSVARMGISWRQWTPVAAFLTLAPLCELLTLGSIYPVLLYLEGGTAALERGGGFLATIAGALTGLGDIWALPLLMVAIAAALGLRATVEFLILMRTQRLSASVQHGLRVRGMSSFLSAEMPFHLNRRRGEIYNGLLSETKRIGALVAALSNLIAGLLQAAIYIMFIVYLAPQIAILGALYIGVIFAVVRVFVGRASAMGKELTGHSNTLSIRLLAALQSIRLVKLRAQEAATSEVLAAQSAQLSDVFVRVARLNAALAAVMQPVLLTMIMALVAIAKTSYGMGLGELGLLAFAGLRLLPAVNSINNGWLQVVGQRSALDGFESLIEGARRWRPLSSGTTIPGGLTDSIRLEGVRFEYRTPEERILALDGIDLDIRKGELVALVGRSGAGKSTIVDLLVRLYDPYEGRVLFDGIDIRDMNLQAYRRRIEVVSQETAALDDSIRANVGFGLSRKPGDPAIWRALRAANCEDFVAALPKGLDSMIGDGGVRLSGGQRQRLAIARALAAEPDVLLLDEPTSALDSESEAAIQKTLSEMRGRTTIVVIAHRLSTIRRADRIAVIEDGRVVEIGAHDALIARDGPYKALFEMQSNI